MPGGEQLTTEREPYFKSGAALPFRRPPSTASRRFPAAVFRPSFDIPPCAAAAVRRGALARWSYLWGRGSLVV